MVNGLISVIRERRDSLRSDSEDDSGQEARIEEECYKHTHTHTHSEHTKDDTDPMNTSILMKLCEKYEKKM